MRSNPTNLLHINCFLIYPRARVYIYILGLIFFPLG
jgi:hypothetical protein